MSSTQKPKISLARKVLPKGLLEAIVFVFSSAPRGLALVGGTALSGFYAGHRRSDDMDLFTESQADFDQVLKVVESLGRAGAIFSNTRKSAGYFRTLCVYQHNSFTIDVVLDENLFQVGEFLSPAKGHSIRVPSLMTLFKMKASTLISRGSEKDLYDLIWLFENIPHLTVKDLVEKGQEIDAGVEAESLLISIAGTKLQKEACEFGLRKRDSAEKIFRQIRSLQKELIQSLTDYARKQNPKPLTELLKKVSTEK